MSKLSYEDKVNIYYDRQEGASLASLCQKYGIVKSTLQYLLRYIDKYGLDTLRRVNNRAYTAYEKEEMVNRVLINNETIMSVALDNGLTSKTPLQNWIKKYKENGYNIVERKRGRPTMLKKFKEVKQKETMEEENERLKKENLYLKAELEYSKKLRAVVQARKNQQQKKK